MPSQKPAKRCLRIHHSSIVRAVSREEMGFNIACDFGWGHLDFLPRFHTATAEPEADLEISITIWPMQSIHGDWYREVSVEYDGTRIAMRLFADTGWWRRSNLYVYTSVTYVIHEGQNGCFAFTAEPTEFVDMPSGVCAKRSFVNRDAEQGSRLYRGLEYLGHFHETYRDPEGVRIRFFKFEPDA